MFGRKTERRSQRQQLMDELVESYSHLKLAAGHVAGGTAEKVTPTYDRARDAASRGWGTTRERFSPLYEQMREGAANARKEYVMPKKKRWPILVVLLAAGTAVGAAGAVIARRRRAAAQWDEYDPMPAVTGMSHDAEGHGGHKVSAGAASVAETVSTRAGKIADSLHERSGHDQSMNGRDATRPTGIAGLADHAEKDTKPADKPAPKSSDPADKHKH